MPVTKLSYQSPAKANTVLDAIMACFGSRTTALRFAVAYVTKPGASLLIPSLASRVGEQWDHLPKTLVTCFDYGHTEPAALTYLQDFGVEVRIANTGADGSIRIQPPSSAFHPKFYLGVYDNMGRIVIGSANLSRRALSVNSEVVSTIHLEHLHDVNALWRDLLETTVPLTKHLLNDYVAKRRSRPAGLASHEPVVPAKADPGSTPVFREAVEGRDLILAEYRAFWIMAGFVSGGSRTQLELPRYAQRFFGYNFDNYDDGQHTIGDPIITVEDQEWQRPLAWHGNNRMERLNLPTPAQSQLHYTNKVIMLERAGNRFRLSVTDPQSSRAKSWHDESAAATTLFRVSVTSQRLCGLL